MESKSSVAKIDWYRSPVDKEVMSELLEISNRKGLYYAGGNLLLILLTGLITVYVWGNYSFLYVLPLMIIHNNIYSIISAPIHELSHERVFTKKWMNRFFLNIYSFMYWWNHPLLTQSHKEHHRYTCNNPLDQETVLPQGFSFINNFLLPNTFSFKRLYYTIVSHFCLAMGKPAMLTYGGGADWVEIVLSKMSNQEKRAMSRFSMIILIGHLGIVTVSILTGYWIIPLITTFAPFLFAFFETLIGYTQHIGLMSGVRDFRLNCRTYYTNPFFQFLYWNMNFHIEHHMYASVPCYNLPRLHSIIKNDLPITPKSLYAVWIEILYIVNRQRVDPGYEYRQPFPGSASREGVKEKTDIDSVLRGSADLGWSDEELASYKIWECKVCAFIYDEAYGLPEEGIAPGTRWEDIPDDWSCPDCGVSKADFDMVERMRFSTPSGSLKANVVNDDPVVVVGSGIAGYKFVEEFRKINQNQKVVVYTRDGGENYSKPILSIALSKNLGPEEIGKVYSSEMENRLHVKINPRTIVHSINSERKLITVESQGMPSTEVKYSQLVLALGADQIQIPMKGTGAEDVFRINDLDSYTRFRQKLEPQAKVIILGGGLIGCEFANDLSGAGYGVHVVDLAESPLASLIPLSAGRYLQAALADRGVTWSLGTSIDLVEKVGSSYRCTLSDGTIIEGDQIISAIGLRPRTDLAVSAGLKVNRGIVVDEYMRTSDASIYALGDCAEIDGKIMPYIDPVLQAVRPLASSINGKNKKVQFESAPIRVKTTCCEVACVPPSLEIKGGWQFDDDEEGLKCIFTDQDDVIRGYAYVGKCARGTLPQINKSLLPTVS